MDKRFLKEQMMRLETNYGVDRFRITKNMFDLWFDMFGELNEKGFAASVTDYMKANEFPPTIASIMKIYKAKKELRDEVGEYVTNMYKWVVRWYGEEPETTTYDQFKHIVYSYPLNKVKEETDNLAQKVIGTYNDNLDNPEKKNLYEVLKGIICEQKGRS